VNDEQNPFRAALEWFGPNGERWGKGEFVLPSGKRCAYGGLAAVLDIDIEDDACLPHQYESALDAAAEALFPDRFVTIWADARNTAAVNDHDDTTWPDIEQVLEKAAVRWDERL